MRYDGRNVKLFESNSEDDQSLSHNDAGNLMLDAEGNIWVGTWGGGVNQYDPTTGQYARYLNVPDDANSLSSNRIQSLFQDNAGDIWLGSYDKGLNRFLGNGRFQRVQKIPGDKNSLSHNRIWDIIDNDADSLWVATSYGINLLDKKTLNASISCPNQKTKRLQAQMKYAAYSVHLRISYLSLRKTGPSYSFQVPVSFCLKRHEKVNH